MSEKPTAWYDKGAGSFYLSKDAIPTQFLAQEARIVALGPIATPPAPSTALNFAHYPSLSAATRQASDDIRQFRAKITAKPAPSTASEDGLPPLPKRTGLTLTMPDRNRVCELLCDVPMDSAKKQELFTADQMRDYARAALAATQAEGAKDGLQRLASNLIAELDASLYLNDYCGLEVDKRRATAVTSAIEALRVAAANPGDALKVDGQ